MARKKGAKTKISSKDIQKVADKLDGFIKDLPAQEQNVLGWILTRAQAAPPAEVSAAASQAASDVPAFKTPTATQLARSVGLGSSAKTQVTVVVGWIFRFGRATHDVDIVTNPAVGK